MPGVASTSGRLHSELLRLLFLQAHRETEEYCRLFGMPAQTNQDSFRYKRAAFYSGIKVHTSSSALALTHGTRTYPCSIPKYTYLSNLPPLVLTPKCSV